MPQGKGTRGKRCRCGDEWFERLRDTDACLTPLRLGQHTAEVPGGAWQCTVWPYILETADNLDQVKRFPQGFWSLTVTGTWRLIFRYDDDTNTASEIDLIDYH